MKKSTPFEKALYLTKTNCNVAGDTITRQNQAIKIKKKYFNSFFNCYLAVPQPTLGHYRGAALLTRC